MQRRVPVMLVVVALAGAGTPPLPSTGEKETVSAGGGYPWSDGWLPGTALIRERCRRSLEMLRLGLRNQSSWAFQMMDSSALVPTGLVFGSTHQLGHYEECMGVEAPFWGMYCLASVHLDWREAQDFGEDTIWSKIKEMTLVCGTLIAPVNSTRVKSMISREWLWWGACLPSSCSADDARAILSVHFRHMRNALKVHDKGVTVGHVSCRTMDPVQEDLNPEWLKPLTTGQLATCLFLLGLLTTVISATAFEGVFDTRRSAKTGGVTWKKILLCFSLRRNWSRLSKTRPPHLRPATFDSVHGLKTFTMLLVTVGHRSFFSLGSPMFNAQYIEDFYTRPETCLIMGGTILVDTFFFVSGCLVANGALEQRGETKAPVKLVLAAYVRRYLRLVPAFMVVVVFYATLLPRLGSGPLWESRMGEQRDNCLRNWWTNLLLLHTIVRPQNMCVIQSWYVAVEFHAFLLCAPIAMLLRTHHRLAACTLAVATAVSLLVPFVITVVYHLGPTLMPFISVLQDLSRDPTFLRVYIPTYMRTAPYFFGMLCAMAIQRVNKSGLKLCKKLAVTFHICSFVIFLIVCYSAWIFFRPEASGWSPVAAATFSAFSRIGWSLAMAWQLFAPATGNGWWTGRLMAWRPLAPFGRLTYGALLTHAAIQLYDVSSMATPQNTTIFYLTTRILSDFVLSHFLAMLLYLSIEAPVASLEKIAIGASSDAQGSAAKDENLEVKKSLDRNMDPSNRLIKEKYTKNESQH